MQKEWTVSEAMPPEFSGGFPHLSPIVLQLLWNRGLREAGEIQSFLSPNYESDLHDPFLFRDMERAVERLTRATDAGEKILIHGDYDADGVCAATLLSATLSLLGAKAEVFLPHREHDGYGLNGKNVERFHAEGVRVIVTCDCGIANTAEIGKAQELGIDVIITDHHALPEQLPPAYATIHPKVPGEKYPWDGLAGGGVAFKLAQALLRKNSKSEIRNPKIPEGYEKWLLDLVAISSVADMVPLLGETRALVKYGLVVLQKTKRVGLRKLMEVAGVLDENGLPVRAIDATTIGFQIAPRINAAGRLDHAKASYALLIENDPEKAGELAAALQAANTERQRLTELCVSEARASVTANGWSDDPAIVVAGDWPPGLVGLVAAKLAEQFYRPVFAVSERERSVGSGRSIPDYHVVEAMRTFPHVFEKFGGHPQACGFTVKNGMVAELRERLRAHAESAFAGKELRPRLQIDAEVALEAVTEEFLELLRQLEPYGMGNPEPRFLSRGVRIRDMQRMGTNGKHLRLNVAHHSGEGRKMVAFGFGERSAAFAPGDIIDVVFTVGINEWNGNREVQMKVVDWRRSA